MPEDALSGATEAGGAIDSRVAFSAAGGAEIASVAGGLGSIIGDMTRLARNPIVAAGAAGTLTNKIQDVGKAIATAGDKLKQNFDWNTSGLVNFGNFIQGMPGWAMAASAAVTSYGMNVYAVAQEMRQLTAENMALSTQDFDPRMFMGWRRDMRYIVRDMQQVENIYRQLRTYHTGASQSQLQNMVGQIASLEEFYNIGIANMVQTLDFELGEGIGTTDSMYDFAYSLQLAGMEVNEFIPQLIRMQSQYRMVGGDIKDSARALLSFSDVLKATPGAGEFKVTGQDIVNLTSTTAAMQGDFSQYQNRVKIAGIAQQNFGALAPAVQQRLNAFTRERYGTDFVGTDLSRLGIEGLRKLDPNTFQALMSSLSKLSIFADDMSGGIAWSNILGLPDELRKTLQALDEVAVLEGRNLDEVSNTLQTAIENVQKYGLATRIKTFFSNFWEAISTVYGGNPWERGLGAVNKAKSEGVRDEEELARIYNETVVKAQRNKPVVGAELETNFFVVEFAKALLTALRGNGSSTIEVTTDIPSNVKAQYKD